MLCVISCQSLLCAVCAVGFDRHVMSCIHHYGASRVDSPSSAPHHVCDEAFQIPELLRNWISPLLRCSEL